MVKNSKTQLLTNILLFLFVAIFLALSGRFIYIQATGSVQGVDLKEWAARQRTNQYELPANRGVIYDRNGMELAKDIATYNLYAIVDESYSPNPEKRLNHVADVDITASSLAPILGGEERDIRNTLETGIDNDKFQVEFGRIGRQLTQEQKNAIDDLELPGIHFIEQPKRYYPNGIFASQVIGFAQDNDESTITGLTGIEALLNDHLTGQNGSVSFQRDSYNMRLLDANEVMVEEEDGNHVHLTIDQKIQTFLEDALTQVMEQYEPERITATVIDPKTGEILAMSNRPSYDPNDLGEVENWFNDVVSTPIEPGSTMKAFTIAAAIEEGIYQPEATYQSGRFMIDQISRPVSDYNRSWGEITFAEGFQRSSNVAMSKLVWDKMGPSTFRDYLTAFHFDRPTGIDLPREQQGTILYNFPIEQITSSFGQGTTVTPIQLLKAATSIANQGKMMKPYVISHITDASTGEVVEQKEPEVAGTPISEDTAKQVLEALESVVTSDVGTGRRYALTDYRAGGKTGTAQISNPEGGYLTGHQNYIFSFLGMAPIDDPELMMYITVQQPNIEEDEAGSAPVSFIFRHVMESSLHYLNIKPDKDPEEQVLTYRFPDVIGKSVVQVKEELTEAGLRVEVIGDGDAIANANVIKDDIITTTRRVLLVTDQPTMPDVTNWSLRNVLEFADLVQLDIEVFGSGFATFQSVDEGSVIEENSYLVVEFAPPNQKTEEFNEETDSDQNGETTEAEEDLEESVD
ncbi:penicillin-binding protein 2B [Natronobacillus azotifigens]|uniref:serine-type D-Ala-D-Ala carboxypeptidase n=1 Tax=Natronobacillus azotifigens TaxID=472978 RepID=A0A9J6RGJ9_9BACI|nr:penicillin-binding protein [Natronobacillus azotifigens]